ncbi:uncharacterized protein LOC128206623 [Mya arenaria]|uniref:uncharacterized protein LOC128206623 n=1 Tax=Mya arenaria TaxID=6604 RepID=UPI0022E0FE84|nr:uncharacterized protein LOC128206623 [Mya arenaria]
MTGLLQLLLLVSTTLASEPSDPACSKYDFEEKVLERMIRMEFAFEKVLTENKVVSETVEQDLTRIKKENKRLYDVVDALKAEHEQAERRLVSLMEDVKRNQTVTLEQAERRLVSLMEDVSTNSNNTLERISAAFDNMTDQIATPLVSFHARSPQTTTLSTGEVIVYKTVETNLGNGYSATTGKFTAPAPGLYLFFMHTCTPRNKYDVLQIVKDGSVLIASIQRDNDEYSCTSSQVFVQLDAGETVWVTCSSGDSDRQLYDTYQYWTSFGGALIHK